VCHGVKLYNRIPKLMNLSVIYFSAFSTFGLPVPTSHSTALYTYILAKVDILDYYAEHLLIPFKMNKLVELVECNTRSEDINENLHPTHAVHTRDSEQQGHGTLYLDIPPPLLDWIYLKWKQLSKVHQVFWWLMYEICQPRFRLTLH
jgi:hypothetical protein